ncbi:MAG TPA: zinc finger domain-containing protein [archaeon]|nr:zinc finger domain-containing protein [archaeon]
MVSEKAENAEKSEKAEEAKAEKEEILMKCTSCGMKIEAEDRWVRFPCPKCGKQKIIRCNKCKKLMNSYECKKCGFIGP